MEKENQNGYLLAKLYKCTAMLSDLEIEKQKKNYIMSTIYDVVEVLES